MRYDQQTDQTDQADGVCWLQISAGIGPEECAWVVTRLTDYLLERAAAEGIRARLIETEPAGRDKLLKSALISLEGPAAGAFAADWQGTVQWIGASPFRPSHKRKNWFVGLERFAPPPRQSLRLDELRFETTRSSGPGGQNVNKVETAVRVTHLPTGLSVLASQERSQWRNRQLGIARLLSRIEASNAAAGEQARSERWLAHHALERGNARHVFKGPDFTAIS